VKLWGKEDRVCRNETSCNYNNPGKIRRIHLAKSHPGPSRIGQQNQEQTQEIAPKTPVFPAFLLEIGPDRRKSAAAGESCKRLSLLSQPESALLGWQKSFTSFH